MEIFHQAKEIKNVNLFIFINLNIVYDKLSSTDVFDFDAYMN